MHRPLATDLLQALLDRMPVARLALRDLDDQPEALPIVFARVGETLYSPIDGKPKRGRTLGRLARLERAPGVMLVLDHYDADWSRLWWVRLRCQTRVFDTKYPGWAAAEAALADKYPQYASTPMFSGEPTLLAFEWSGVSWWSAAHDAFSRWLEETGADDWNGGVMP